jgi:hypothetical protein
VSLRLLVLDKSTRETLIYAQVEISGAKTYNAVTNDKGELFIESIPSGEYRIKSKYIGYADWEQSVSLSADKILTIEMESNRTLLDEVVVTATESAGMTSSSLIDRKAMQHLQPVTFTDILELLPGRLSKDPALTGVNLISLRQSTISDTENQYGTSSLGTAFLIDGVPLSANADMHSFSRGDGVSISGDEAYRYRLTTNRGIDMRALSTDGIDHVEIIRGIPSVRYGDLTSGVVNIERKKGTTPLSLRFLANGYSKLFAAEKGFRFDKRNLDVNVGADYLDAKSNPTNRMENYQRINASVRLNKKWMAGDVKINWAPNFDFGHTVDRDKTDPDIDYTYIDSYRSSNDRFSLRQTISFDFTRQKMVKSVELKTGVTYENDRIHQVKFVQITTPTAIPSSTEEGEHDGIYLPSNWVSDLRMDGRPLNLFAQATTELSFNTWGLIHNVMGGLDWHFDKNYGQGMIYDPSRPPSGSTDTRPRAYSDVPASHLAAFFVEDVIGFPVAANYVKMNVGLRGSSMLNLQPSYEMYGKLYPEPRISAQWIFPDFQLWGRKIQIDITAGYGWSNKFPTLIQLYPDYTYLDAVQLNYYHANPDYRRIYIKTFKRKHVNDDLRPAQNRKFDLRLKLNIHNNKLAVNYFQERTTTAFRTQVAAVEPLVYKDYIVPDDYTETHEGRPDLEELAYVNDTYLHAFPFSGNGSIIDKEGVEFTFQSPRWDVLKTRLTLDGAWFKTEYSNSAPYYYKPYQLVNNRRIEKYGVYQQESGYIREELNTKVMLDTYLPELDMEFSTSVQCAWFHLSQNKPRSETPEVYIDTDGSVHPYTEQDKKDMILQYLYTPHNPNSFRKERVPFGMSVNLKASKNFRRKVRVSLYVNKLLDYYPVYEVYGAKIRRAVDPYFGMELNFTL